MSKEYSFNVMPSVSISRSRFARKSQHKTSFNLGDIVPVYCDEVLPGDTRSLDMASLVRMSTPIAPIMDNIYIDYYAFFTPCRLLWVHWKEFMGENNVSAGIPSVSYSIPFATDYNGDGIDSGRLGDYFGLPIDPGASQGIYNDGSGGNTGAKVSALPFRAYYLIYNEWFRNQNVIAPYAIQTGDTDEILVDDSTDGWAVDRSLCKASKLADYFIKALPYAQKGSAVTLPLGTTAPIILHDVGGGAPTAGLSNVQVNWSGTSTETQAFATTSGGAATVYADLQNATAAPINLIRYAFQLQKALEKDALYGSRYWEILAAHFGIKAPDASLQRPEYLGGFRQRVNIDQVLSTAGYDDQAATQEVGKPGANSVTGGKFSLFTKSFTEHGYLFILAVARHDQTYCQGINRMWSRRNRFDFYFPVFANLGAQEIKKKEIYALGTSSDDQVFGYQEAWAEYRYKPSFATGLLNPSAAGSLDFWTLANKFSVLPTLGRTFIEQGRDNIQRALTTGLTGPDFIADFYFEDVAVRPMPMYSIPGLVDHH